MFDGDPVIRKLSTEIERAHSRNAELLSEASELAADLRRVMGENERLRAALRPFAECYDLGSTQCDMPDERMLMFASEGGGTYLGFASVRDLRHASEALHGVDGQSVDDGGKNG